VKRFVTRNMAATEAMMRVFIASALLGAGGGIAVTGAAAAQTQTTAQTDQTNAAEQQLLDKTNAATKALIAGSLDDALTLFDEVIATNASAPRLMAAAHYHRGIIHQKRGAFNEAAADYTTALWLEALPDNMRARAHYNRGTALDNLGQQERAKSDFDTAISLMPDMAAAYNNRANVLRRMGNYEAAIADYDKSIELKNPLPHLPHFGRAAALNAMGDTEGARQDLTKAVSLAPDFKPAQAALASLPAAPSALTTAATPEAVAPAARNASADIVGQADTQVTPVETAMLPAPERAADPIAAPAAKALKTASAANASQRADTARGAAVPAPLATPVQRNLATIEPATANEARRITTASSAASAGAPAASPAPAMPMLGLWTTTILPAGSKEAIRLDDAGPALSLKSDTETQVASMSAPTATMTAVTTSGTTRAAATSPQPKKGLAFQGVPAEPYRSAALAPAQSPATSTARPGPAAGGAGYAVQLGSFRSETEANGAWRAVTGRLGSMLLDRDHMVQRADVPGKGVYYRLRVGPMSAKSTASTLCSSLKAQGQDCYVTKL